MNAAVLSEDAALPRRSQRPQGWPPLSSFNLSSPDGIEQVRALAAPGRDIALLLSLGKSAHERSNVLARRLARLGFRSTLALTSNHAACNMIEGACGFSGKYLAHDPHTIRMPIRARVYVCKE